MQEFFYLAPSEIKVDRAERQRRVADPGDLIDSVKRLGILNPLIIRQDYTLVAGERRLEAAKALALPLVPVRFFEDLDSTRARIIELEENLKRQDLPWQDEVRAIVELHKLCSEANPKWTQESTGVALGISKATVTKVMRVHEDMDKPAIASATGLNTAYNMLLRKDDRAFADVMTEIGEVGSDFFAEPKPETEVETEVGLPSAPTSAFAPPERPEDQIILHADFKTWIETYSGPRFNFIHCDFPYGIKAFSGPQSGRDHSETYDDDPQVYWKLIETFAKHIDSFMAPSAHLMFWCAADIEIQYKTLETFARIAPSLSFQTYPLIWVKSDNIGILPDPKRGPRRVYETAMIASREDRQIAKAVANAYSAPTDKSAHPSTKPEPMLRHFFQMFIDENSSIFDPTCGSGAALRAAESLGAKRALGLEISEEHCKNARSAFRQFRSRQALGRI